MRNGKKVRFAVIGLGLIGRKHIDMIRQNPSAELVALCDSDSEKYHNYLELNLPFFNSLEALLSSGLDIDVVSIATPNGLHARHALASFEAGKHVVIEKPMALTKADCEKIVYSALQANRLVFCIMQNRYSPVAKWIKSVIESGRLGQIFMVQVNCYWNRDERYYRKGDWKGTRSLDGGPLFTQFSHFLDMMYWLLGDITNIQARFRNFNHQLTTEFEDSGTFSFDFVSGGSGVFNYSTSVWDKNMESSVTIIAQNGSIKIGGQYMNEVEYCHIRDYTMPILPAGNPANDYGHYKGSAANHNYVFENVVDVLKGRTSISTNALEGLKVVDMIERVYAWRPSPNGILAMGTEQTIKLPVHSNGQKILETTG